MDAGGRPDSGLPHTATRPWKLASSSQERRFFNDPTEFLQGGLKLICNLGSGLLRWSAIAAKLPGRTDNDIKNVWNTHLKKRLNPDQPIKESKRRNRSNARRRMAQPHEPPAPSRSDASPSLVTTTNREVGIEESRVDFLKWLPEIDRTVRCPGESTANGGCAVVKQQGSLKDEDVVSFWINLLAEAGKSS
ncbi:hypothetical protein HPP92_014508 [Vanilla planifolia]|uniref:Uncharacterized protein n=1 Tax=Vanilla planifolia TaxID=51239 RepID=A0A835QKL0_VANPL|nr:hypothetical protein HPP92_014508 [Vanilla planifolia]